MEEVKTDEKNNWKSIAKKVKRHAIDCMTMYQMLMEYKKLGKVKVIMENGIKVYICPPAYCRNARPDRNVSQKS